MESKKQQLEAILEKYNKGMITEDEKYDAVCRLMEQEARQIWGGVGRKL